MKKNLSFFQQTIQRGVVLALVVLLFLTLKPFNRAAAAPLAGSISGNVFRDYDADGVDDGSNEPGLGGVVVTAVDDLGNTQTTTSAADGSYTVPSLAGNSTRVEFTLPGSGALDFLQPGVAGNTTVQFVDISGGNATNVNVGFHNPAQYCQADPEMATSVLFAGTTSEDAGLARFNYSSTGNAAAPANLSTWTNIGATYGLAYDAETDNLYAAAYVKRHSALGGGGAAGRAGAIYRVTDATGTSFSAPTVFATIPNVGTVPDNATRALPPNPADPSFDPAVFGLVGTTGLGDMEISDDGSTLYVVNLNDKSVYPVATATGAVGTPIVIPDPGCTNGQWRPFATKFQDGDLYVGGICSAETGGTRANLTAQVYRYDVGTATWSGGLFSTPISLNFARGRGFNTGTLGGPPDDGFWNPWINNGPTLFSRTTALTGDGGVLYPQPILSDIEFDSEGYMLLGFRDRTGDQVGYLNQAVDATDYPGSGTGASAIWYAAPSGDILMAAPNGATFTLENNGVVGTRTTGNPGTQTPANQGPGGREFFYQEAYPLPAATFHQETSFGALAILPGSTQLTMTAYDDDEIDEGTVYWMDMATGGGDQERGYRIYWGNQDSFPPAPENGRYGKANGLGDLELLCSPAPIEVGNRIWQDNDGDGVQDPAEPAIGGVTVGLYDSNGTQLATDTTGPNGLYYFTSDQTTGTVARQVNASSDDARQQIGAAPALAETDLRLGHNANPAQPGVVGLRFQNITIPPGAIITAAYIQFFTDDGALTTAGNPANFTIDGQAAANPGTFTAAVNNISGRARTTTQVLWSTPTWAGTHISGPAQRTPDISGIVQEIIGLGGWASGNAMVFIVNETVASHRDAQAFDGATGGADNIAAAPVLVIKYALPGPTNYAPMQYSTPYEVRVNLSQAPLNGLSVTTPDSDATSFGDLRDSDGQVQNGGYVAAAFTTSGPGANNHTFDFGFIPRVSLGDRVWNDEDNDGQYDQPVRVGDFVWYDVNSNGLQDSGEPGVNNVAVALHRATDANCAAAPLAIVRAAPDGSYLFDNLPPGNYFVCFDLTTLPAGFTVTTQNAGADTLDSDADPTTGQTAATGPLTAGQQDMTLDMGIVTGGGTVAVGDRVWYDNNSNGRQDAGEVGVPGVTVSLQTVGQTCADTDVATLITDNNGNYLFTGLTPGNYFVCFVPATIPAGYTPTTPNNQADDSVDSDPNSTGQTAPTGALSAGQVNVTLDMGIVSTGNVTVGDYVWFDDNFNGLQDGDEAGVPGVSVALHLSTDANCAATPLAVTTTNGAGAYLFTGLPSGNYFVCFDLTTLPAGYSPTVADAGGDTVDSDANPATGATPATGVILVGNSDATLDMGIVPTISGGQVAIGDRVWYDDNRNGAQDAGEAGVPGVTVSLQTAGQACTDPDVATTTTNNNGYYLFNNQAPGDYFVCFDLTTIPTGYGVTLQDASGNDGDDSDANATTGQTGNTGAIPANTANLTLDMGIYAPDHELPIPGVTVQLYAAATPCDGISFSIQVTTDANGNYVFPNLPAGDYYVHIPASNFTAGQALEYMISSTGNDPAPDPDADSSNTDDNGTMVLGGACNGGVSSSTVTLAVNTEPTNDGNTAPNTPDPSHNLTVDFGLFEPLCIGDLVWFDADNSGTVNGTEYGLNGINLNLYQDVDGDGIFEPGGDDGAAIANTTTAQVGGVDGSYSFCDVPKGNYFIHIANTEFQPGDLLYLFGSSTANNNPETNPAEDDDNGTDGGDASTNGIASVFPVSLAVRTEPTADNNTNDNGRRDASTNQTVDLGIYRTVPMDYGDLPTTYNNTILGDNGPRHSSNGLSLGTVWDADNDGQESALANGDDNNNDDEDGVTFTGNWSDGAGEINVVTSGDGCLNVWLDFTNGAVLTPDGDFNDTYTVGGTFPEHVVQNLIITGGATPVTFNLPLNAANSATLNLRARLTPRDGGGGCAAAEAYAGGGGASPTGLATGGEVEDYQRQFSPTAINLAALQTLGITTVQVMVIAIAMFLTLLTGLVYRRSKRF